jgi:ATP-dependent Clp protease ATP-binding subunit ClpC
VGVGKTSIVYGLARKIYWGETVPALSHYRVVALDLGSILSYAKHKGDFQEILTRCLNEAVSAGNVILFIDEIQKLFSGESEGTIDASDILAPYLESSSLKIIGTTSAADFQTYLVPKNIFASNFDKVEVEPTDKNETIKILGRLSPPKIEPLQNCYYLFRD